jgi:hypothetical protein
MAESLTIRLTDDSLRALRELQRFLRVEGIRALPPHLRPLFEGSAEPATGTVIAQSAVIALLALVDPAAAARLHLDAWRPAPEAPDDAAEGGSRG